MICVVVELEAGMPHEATGPFDHERDALAWIRFFAAPQALANATTGTSKRGLVLFSDESDKIGGALPDLLLEWHVVSLEEQGKEEGRQ